MKLLIQNPNKSKDPQITQRSIAATKVTEKSHAKTQSRQERIGLKSHGREES
jgi:hypothetical protein